MKNFQEKPIATKILAIAGTLVIILLIFSAGVTVGYHKAEFSSRWENHYPEVFGGRGSPFMGMMPKNFIGSEAFTPNGAVGKIVAINFPEIAVQSQNQIEKVIVIGPNTQIRKFREIATTSDMHIGDMITAIGSPDVKSRINATFIRIMPTLSTSSPQAPYSQYPSPRNLRK